MARNTKSVIKMSSVNVKARREKKKAAHRFLPCLQMRRAFAVPIGVSLNALEEEETEED